MEASENQVEKMRHTLSHVLAAAVRELYPTAKFGIGPAVANGFYYDIDFGEMKVAEADLKKIEKKMRGIIARGAEMRKREVAREEALKWAAENGQVYKTELIEELPFGEKITFYDLVDSLSPRTSSLKPATAPSPHAKCGSVRCSASPRISSELTSPNVLFVDLCKGPHIESLKEVGAWKLERIAGAYWRGDEKRAMLTRIYGLAFATEGELEEFLARQEEAKKRDHRRLGKELDLFCFSELVGAGLPLFTPRGTVLREELSELSLGLRGAKGFKKVWTPHITKVDLYKKSGHYAKFGDELFMVHSQVNGEEFAMKPMNCPHHAQIFASKPRTYKEMPVRYMEATTDYRDEKTGELGGLNRVRSLTQDDSHVFCRKSQIKQEIQQLVEIVRKLYATVGMEKLRARLSYRDESEKYLGDPSLWEMAQGQIREAAEENGLDYFEQEGEAAFYGPKIDFMAEDALGREHQVATVQLDFVQPERFGLEFVNEKGEKERPVMVHHATLGSIERFLSVFIEHTGGWFPLWCAPEAVRVLMVGDVGGYVAEVETVLRDVVLDEPVKGNELRYSVDASDDSLGKKIKRATEMKIPVIIIIGAKDAAEKVVSVRTREGEEKVKLAELAGWLKARSL